MSTKNQSDNKGMFPILPDELEEILKDAPENVSAAPADAVAALVVGQVPDGLTDNIKTNVDGLCVACHISGVGNAPKIGDQAAWQERGSRPCP